jgi:hypothetical protein
MRLQFGDSYKEDKMNEYEFENYKYKIITSSIYSNRLLQIHLSFKNSISDQRTNDFKETNFTIH